MNRAGVAAAAAARLREQAAAIAKHADGEPGPDTLHDLRVACRRLETALRLWARGAAARAARSRARAIRRAVGPARDHEVLCGMLRARRLGAGLVPAPLRRAWLVRLEDAPASARQEALPGPRSVAALQKRVARVALDVERAHGLEQHANERLRRWRKVGRARLAEALESGEPAALHRARLALRRWRYAEEARATVARGRSRAPRAALRRWQRALGRLHDRASLIEFVAGAGTEARRWVPRLEAQRRKALGALRRHRAALVSPPRARSRLA